MKNIQMSYICVYISFLPYLVLHNAEKENQNDH